MDESILTSTKSLLGICEEDKAFDQDILVCINSVFSTLYQIGVKMKDFSLSTGTEKWSEIFSEVPDLIDFIKTYTFMKVRLIFDPPTSSTVLGSLNSQIDQIEWRIHVQAEGGFDERD